MWKELVYNHETYSNFLIDQNGNIKNQKTQTIYKITYHQNGYAVITLPLGQRGKVKSIRLHKALAETFISNPNQYKVVHHKDGNRKNFALSNLEWVSSKINTQYSLQQQIKQTPYFNNRKLTQADVLYIRTNPDKKPYSQLAREYNVSKTTIANVIQYKFYNNGVW